MLFVFVLQTNRVFLSSQSLLVKGRQDGQFHMQSRSSETMGPLSLSEPIDPNPFEGPGATLVSRTITGPGVPVCCAKGKGTWLSLNTPSNILINRCLARVVLFLLPFGFAWWFPAIRFVSVCAFSIF